MVEHTAQQKYNTDLATRQIEINEWSYHNKMDTLFVLQLTFLSVLFIAVLMYFHQIGYLGMAFIVYVGLILGVILLILIVNRATFTSYRRDPRFWNRRRFGEDNVQKSPMAVGGIQDYVDAVRSTYGSAREKESCKPCDKKGKEDDKTT